MNEMTITKFLSAFFANENDRIVLVTLPPSGVKGFAKFYDTSYRTLAKNTHLKKQLIEDNKTKGVYFIVNSGGTKDAEISKFNAFFIENDEISIEEQHKTLDEAPIQPSIRVETKKSVHAYWLIKGNCSEVQWRDIQSRLIAFFKSDKRIKNPARCLRVPFLYHVSPDRSRKIVELAAFHPSKRFSVEEMKNAFPSSETYAKPSEETAADKQLTSSLNSYESVGSGNGVIAKEAKAVERTNSLSSSQVDKNVKSESVPVPPHSSPGLRRKCFHGLAGEVVRVIEPHTEADSMALLLNTLIAFGNIIGRTAFFEADGAKHYTNLFGVLVGSTSAGKGSSWSQIRNLFELVNNEWSRNQVQRGLSSGEGLIAAVRDEDSTKDKRLLVVESEFSSVLSMTKRDGNTLSPIIRSFWDEGSAQIMTKNNPISVHDAHISIIGHITPGELRARLNQTELANGFVNRFLWLEVKKSKLLPEGGKPSDEELKVLAGKLLEAIEFAQTMEEMKRDEKARLLWVEKYSELAVERGGAFGNATTRVRSQIARLSVIYALMDRSNIIKREHLEAARDFWNHCENSARQIFGESTGDKLADDILQLLRDADNGLSKTEIIKLTGNNFNAKRINDALKILADDNLAHWIIVSKPDSKKPVENWFANEFNELNEINASKESARVKDESNNGDMGVKP